MDTLVRRKSPKPLSQIILDQIAKRVEQRFENWYQNLTRAEQKCRKEWLRVIDFVAEDSVRFYQELCYLSPYITSQILPNILEWFSMLAKVYKELSTRSPKMIIRYKQVYSHIFQATLESLLVPALREYDIRSMTTSFSKMLMVQSIGSTVNVTTLVLPGRPSMVDPAEIADKIQYLPMLTTFDYRHDCTTQVLASVGDTCDRLRELNVRYSRRTTDLCVHSLLKLKKLQKVDIQFTGISRRGYSKLLLGLKLTHILWPYSLDKLLHQLPRDDHLEAVTSVSGTFHSAKILFEKCPQITALTIHSIREALYDLCLLPNITVLNLQNCTYDKVRAGYYLIARGKHLLELRLSKVSHVHLIDIITQCSALKVLEFHSCGFSDQAENLTNHENYRHFKNVECIKITDCDGIGHYIMHMAHYKCLKFLYARNVPALTEYSVDHMVLSGAFYNLEEFVVEDCGLDKFNIFRMVTYCCPKIRKIGNLKKISNVPKKKIDSFKVRVQKENIDVEVIALAKYYVRTNMVHYRGLNLKSCFKPDEK